MTPWCHHRCLSGWLLSLSTQCNLCWHQIIWEAPCCPLITPQPSRTPTQARPLGEVCRRGGFLTTPNPNAAEELQYKQQQHVQMEDGRVEGGLLPGPARQGEAGLDGSGGVGLLSAHSTPKKRWCKRCKTPIGNLSPALLPAVTVMLQAGFTLLFNPYLNHSSNTHLVLHCKSTQPFLCDNVDVWWRIASNGAARFLIYWMHSFWAGM